MGSIETVESEQTVERCGVSCLGRESQNKALRWDWLSVFQEAGVGREESRQGQRGDKDQSGEVSAF